MGSPSGRVSVGHPVDVASGVLWHEFEDHSLAGQLKLGFKRRYSSALSGRAEGMFGPGWSSPFEMRIRRDLEGYRLIGEDGESEICFDDRAGAIESGGVVRNLGAFQELREEKGKLIVTRWPAHPKAGDILQFIFEKRKNATWWLLSAIQNLHGRRIEIQHDASGRVIVLMQRREGRRYQLSYNPAGRVTEVRLSNSVGASSAKQQFPGRDPLVLKYSYDGHGRLVEMTDALGGSCRYEYDRQGRLEREVTLGGMVFRFSYDAQGRCEETTGQDDFDQVTLEFDLTRRVTVATNSRGHSTRYHWNEAGQVEQVVSPLGNTRTTAYDEHGRITRQVQAGGATTSYAYDANGDLAKEISPTGATTVFEYNPRHQLTCTTDALGHRWTQAYDDQGRLISATDPLEQTWSYHYGDEGDLVGIRSPSRGTRRFEWDLQGNLAALSDWQGRQTRYEWDAAGHLSAMVDPLGARSEASSDVLGRVREVRLPDGARRRYAWSNYNHLTEYVDERNAVTRWRRLACGLVSEVIAPNGDRLQYEYSTLPGQILCIRNASGETHRYEYDAEGRRVLETDFSGRTRRYGYDRDGNLISVETASGGRIELKRDLAGALTEVLHEDGSTVRYAYDPRGLMVSADNGDCVIERKYDAACRRVLEKQGAHEIESAYDAEGNRIRRRSSVGDETVFEWDANGQVTRISSREGPALRFEYDARLNEISRSFDGGVSVAQEFDSRGRCVEQRVSSSSFSGGESRLPHRRYAYDAASNLIGMEDAAWGPSKYAHDAVRRLTSVQEPTGWAEHFSYDATNNLTTVGRAEVAATPTRAQTRFFEYRAGGELVGADSVKYEYDSEGQRSRRKDPRGDTRYSWNSSGQLARLTLPNGKQWRYKYDALGRRIQKLGPNQRIDYVWDGDVILHEIRSSSSDTQDVVTWEFHPSGFAPLAKSERGVRYLCVNDAAGAPRELLAPDGRVAWSAKLSAWGELREVAKTEVSCPVRFQGQWHDEESELHYNRYRYYDPATGRYVSRDPIGLWGGLNAYAYSRSPLTQADPYGLTGGCPPLDWSIVSKKGENREDHVRLHNVDNPTRTVPHGVFADDGVAVTNEAWARAHALGLTPDSTGMLNVPMGRDVGLLGGQPGAAANHPLLTSVTIIVVPGTNKLITAYPDT
ncbi:RHS repeat-associated core domain-containing protein [Myxococcus landrumensis]|uniref:RHS repeat protein n=1 Tax=Myxococcus landrumensis TaxID=2813577 RepID=A0ABX7N8X0_9BACT|nr:RHS repeat-associated core domain-containing protein [Myxococcus landrumus]QSQ14916.1 RHS repeat protein [Myxococcus landrumus]